MLGKYCIRNGRLITVKNATLPVDHIEFAYGFGVYENLKVRKSIAYFISQHIERLFLSAAVIGLVHPFKQPEIELWMRHLIEKNRIMDSNIKMILIGGDEPLLYIFQSAPKYLEKKEYREGIKVISYEHERFLPQAKTLNMLPSYIIYKKAQEQQAYDGLLVDRNGNITEGTRSNFFAIRDKTLYTPPLDKVLDGVTRRTVIECAQKNGYDTIEQNIPVNTIFTYDGAFLTNTSGGMVPIRTIDVSSYERIPVELFKLKSIYDAYSRQIA